MKYIEKMNVKGIKHCSDKLDILGKFHHQLKSFPSKFLFLQRWAIIHKLI